MGEAKRKRKRHAAVFKECPNCIYCAGDRPALTVEHMPPRIWFRSSQRPKGLEFASCRECNVGTSAADVVSAFMALTFPGVSSSSDEKEWQNLVSDVRRIAPQVLSEMLLNEFELKYVLSKLGLPKDRTVFWAGGNSTFAHMTTFAAKAGFALHYHFQKMPVSKDQVVQVRWFTNDEWLSGKLPDSMKAALGELQYMSQGALNSEFTFEYGAVEAPNNTPLYVVRSRNAFLLAAFVADKDMSPFDAQELATFKPGDFAKTIAPKILAPRSKREWIDSL